MQTCPLVSCYATNIRTTLFIATIQNLPYSSTCCIFCKNMSRGRLVKKSCMQLYTNLSTQANFFTCFFWGKDEWMMSCFGCCLQPKPTSIQSRLLDTLWCPSKLKDAARSALKEAPLAAAYGMGFSKGEELRQSATGKGPGHGPMDTSDPAKGSDPTLRNWINQLTPMNGVDAAHGMRLFWQVKTSARKELSIS